MKTVTRNGFYTNWMTAGVTLLVLIAISSCNNGGPRWKDKSAELAADTATYSYKTFELRDKNCNDNPDSACTIVKLSYPEFDKLKALNDSITAKFIQLFAQKAARSITTREQLASNFIGTYSYFKRGHPHSPLYFQLDAHAQVRSEDRYIITVEISGYAHRYGIHSDDLTGYVNWNARKNKLIILDNILYPHARDTLTSIAENLFRKNEKISDTASLSDGHRYFFKDGKFALSDTYVLTNYGIKFLYNPNSIKPYAAGKTFVLVPYDNIRPLIRPHFGF